MTFALTACGSSAGTTASTAPAADGSAAASETAAAGTTADTAAQTDTSASPVAGKKIAYIMLMSPATIFQMWSDSFEGTAQKLGMEADTFFCSDNADTWQNQIATCAQSGYDGIMVSHGGQEYAWQYLSDIKAQYPDLKIVTFDTPFKDANGEVAKIDGVMQFFQQDAGFAAGLVDALMELPENKEKVEAGEPLNILQVQQGAGYNSPFDRRQVGYEPYVEDGKIVTVERIAPTDDQNATASMRDVTAATLQKYKDEDIDGIWCCYDAYAQGVYQALSEGNRQIPMVSVDICNEDIQFMQEENSQWKACATTNWTSNGEFACRVLALELADQYDDIRACSCYYDDPGDWLEIPSTIVTQEQVTSKDNITIENLEEVAAESYKDTSWMPTCDW
ncbi:MAG: substrate-binding domain-containing protein, partial [Lachnospiraceae bacterium]|nr:substrate-binding domain-containing protein [Lachnospiraceae bacterium]